MNNSKKRLGVISNVISWLILISLTIALIFTVFNVVEAKRTGEDVYLLGYRPIVVLTGSMEPTMRENSIIISKKVESLNDISVNDIVTYHIDINGETIRVTHRITQIDEDGTIYTKGDNNMVSDAYPIHIENVKSKTVLIMNWVADLVNKWESGVAGKITILCPLILIILLIAYLGQLKAIKAEEEANKKSEQLDAVLNELNAKKMQDSMTTVKNENLEDILDENKKDD